MHVVPTTGGMSGQALVHGYQQSLTQAALVAEWQDKVTEEGKAVGSEGRGVIAGW